MAAPILHLLLTIPSQRVRPRITCFFQSSNYTGYLLPPVLEKLTWEAEDESGFWLSNIAQKEPSSVIST